MNTTSSFAGHVPRIGLIELPELAGALNSLGLHVVTGPGFRGGIAAVKEAFAIHGAFPIIVTDQPIAGLRAWVERIQSVVPIRVAVIRSGAESSVFPDTVAEITLPATLNQVLAAVGLPATAGGDAYFPAAPSARRRMPDLDFTGPAPASPVQQPPAGDLFGLAAAAPAQAPAPVNDPFADDPFAGPGSASSGFAFTPAPPEEGWDHQMPPASALPAASGWDAVAAEVPVQPAPVPAPSPAAEMGWGAVAAETPLQPAPSFTPAPVQQAEEFGWNTVAQETPVQPAPATQSWSSPAAPEQGRHSTADDFGWNTPAPAPDPAPARSGWDAPAPAPAGFGGGHDAAAVFDSFEAAKLHGTGRTAAGLASLVITWSGKGGVGKSTTALQLARMCSEAGMRTILIDGNCGQGDLRTYLRLNRSDLPTIYNAAVGNIESAVLSPATINAAPTRQGLGEIKFGFVAAPPEDIEDGEIVTNATYRSVIEYCRRNADVVILDTQIIEAIDRTRVLSDLLVPALVQDAWGIGVADMTPAGVNNLNARLRRFAALGVAPDRQMIFVNKVPEVQVSDAAKLNAHFSGRATFLGSVTEDSGIRDSMNAGRTELSNDQMHAALSTALLRVTGNDEFSLRVQGPSADAAPGKRAKTSGTAKVGFWGRLAGKKAAA